MSLSVSAPFGCRSLWRWQAVTARQLLAYVWVEVLGRRASDLARALGQTRGNLSTAARRGAAQAARWQAEIPRVVSLRRFDR